MNRYQPRRPGRHETRKFRGLDHHLIRWGPESDDPVLVLHGYADCAASFQFVADEIAPSLRWATAQVQKIERSDGAPRGGGGQSAGRPVPNEPANYEGEEPF